MDTTSLVFGVVWLLIFTSSVPWKLTVTEIPTKTSAQNIGKTSVVATDDIPSSNGLNSINPHQSVNQSWKIQIHITEGMSPQLASLFGLLVDVIEKELSQCNLVFAYDPDDKYSIILPDLLFRLPNLRQVLEIRSEKDLMDISWVNEGCKSYIFLLQNQHHLITLANSLNYTWDYQGRYVVVLQSLEQMKTLAASKKGKKTEHLVGIVKGVGDGEWRMYINQLYWGDGVKFITTWQQHRFTSKLHLFPDKLADLQGAIFKVSTFEFAPSIMYYRDKNGTLIYRYGEDIAIVKTLARVLNFTALFSEPAEGGSSKKVKGNSWARVVGEVMRDQVEIGVANFYIVHSRYQIVSLSAPYKAEKSCFMARVEPPLPRWQALSFPFHPWTWLAIITGILLAGPILFIVANASTRSGGDDSKLANLNYSWLYTFGMHFREPQILSAHKDSTRTLTAFLWLYTIIITIAYSTNLTAFLLVQKPAASIQTIREIYESGLELASVGPIYKTVLASATDPYLQALVNVYKEYTSLEDMFANVLAGKSVVLQNNGFLNFHSAIKYNAKGTPRVRLMKECFAPYSIGLLLQPNTPLKKKIDQVIGWLQHSGLIEYYNRESIELAASTQEYGGDNGDDDDEDKDGTVVALNLEHMEGVFMMAGFGWLIAIIIFFVEYCI